MKLYGVENKYEFHESMMKLNLDMKFGERQRRSDLMKIQRKTFTFLFFFFIYVFLV